MAKKKIQTKKKSTTRRRYWCGRRVRDDWGDLKNVKPLGFVNATSQPHAKDIAVKKWGLPKKDIVAMLE